MTTGGKLNSLEVMRGLSATAVALYHTNLILGQAEYGSLRWDFFDVPASRGWMGVNFFFVLSGFIIVFAHFRDLGTPDLPLSISSTRS